MPAPVITFEDDQGTEISSGNKINFGGQIEKGATSSVFSVWIWNDKDGLIGSGTAVNPRVFALSVGDLSVIFDGTVINGNVSMLEARSCLALNVAADAQDAWTPIGPAQFLDIGDIPRNAAREIQLRLRVPNDAADLALTTGSFKLKL